MSWLWLPHEVTWRPQRDVPRGGSANDGTAASDTPPKALKVSLEPKPAVWAERAFGVVIERRAYLMVGEADDLESMQRGDLIDWNGRTLKLEAAPLVYRPGDSYDSAEALLTDQTTGGRG